MLTIEPFDLPISSCEQGRPERVFTAVSKFAPAAEKVGLNADDLIRLLNEGMTVMQLLDHIVALASGKPVEN